LTVSSHINGNAARITEIQSTERGFQRSEGPSLATVNLTSFIQCKGSEAPSEVLGNACELVEAVEDWGGGAMALSLDQPPLWLVQSLQ
jgi:hypothetical protein